MTAVTAPPTPLPPGSWREIELLERGTTYAYEHPGPPGAATVVLLHGWTATGTSNWSGTLTRLAERYRVVALDHRGHGRGIRSDAPFTLEDCADDVIALLDHLGVERSTLIGYSMGGPIAQLAWRRHPERIDGLVLYATAARFGSTGVSASVIRAATPMMTATLAMARPLLFGALRPATTVVVDDDSGDPYGSWFDSFAHHDINAILQAAREILRFDSRPWIGDVDVPVATIVTGRDRVVSPDRQRELAALVAGATVIERDASHRLPFHDPVASAAAIVEACDHVVPVASASAPHRRSPWTRRFREAWNRRRARSSH